MKESRNRIGAVVLFTLISSFISRLNGQPQGYQAKGQQEPRGIMDEALKKFYFDLYDGADTEDEDDTAGGVGGNHDSHSFNIDDYFDAQENSVNKKQDKFEQAPRYPDNRSTKINNKFVTPRPLALPPPPPPSSPLQSPTAPAPASANDPTFVLSRLLFHLSQLPAQ